LKVAAGHPVRSLILISDQAADFEFIKRAAVEATF
jgi:hypothetical protein